MAKFEYRKLDILKGRRASFGIGRRLQMPEQPRHGRGIYDSPEWKALRKEMTKAHPFCASCGRDKTRLYVDHIVELKDGGAPYDKRNLTVLCGSCHTTKSNAEKRKREGRA